MNFLTAEWRKLVMINYAVPPELLQAYLPQGTELDLWQGKCYLSIVGFLFCNTRLLGIKVPLHTNFEEVNMRFYVTRQEGGTQKRGVVFIKEIVPKVMLSVVANTVYKEHYHTMKMRHIIKKDQDEMYIRYSWGRKNTDYISLTAQVNPTDIAPGSEAEFITEHYWGYTRVSPQKTWEYDVVHPRWKQYPVLQHELCINFKNTYGPRFAFLEKEVPTSVLLAEGSEIAVKNTRRIRR